MSSFLFCCKFCCCLFIVITNVVFIITGILLTLLGFIFAFGFSMFRSVLKETINSLGDSITTLLKDQLGVNIDLFELLTEINIYTGVMGIVLLVVGVTLIVVACIGCCGACCTVRPCLIIYLVMMGIVIIAQACFVAIWFIDAELIKRNVKGYMENNVKEFGGFNSTDIYSFMQNMMQVFVGCCGVTNGTDFDTLGTKWNRRFEIKESNQTVSFNLTYPLTCCKYNLTSFTPIDQYCPYNNTTPATSNYQNGCYTQIFTYIDQFFLLNNLFYSLGGLIGYQVLLMLGAIIILIADRKDNKVKPN